MRPEERRPTASDLIRLEPDHPGFLDREYRTRRDAIAAVALAYKAREPVPRIEYTDEEEAVWRAIWTRLAPLHRERVCREWNALQTELGLAAGPIPQMEALNRVLESQTGSRMEPVAGLVSARVFLQHLGRRVLLSTQFMRHPSRPYYTPEPDLVHEFVGHAATLMHRKVARVHELLGRAAGAASEAEMLRLERVYWYTLEFGVVEERGALRAFGAGLLSSVGELEQLDTGPELCPLDLDRIARTPYDPTELQPRLFVAPSFDELLDYLTVWLVLGRWRDAQAGSGAGASTRATG